MIFQFLSITLNVFVIKFILFLNVFNFLRFKWGKLICYTYEGIVSYLGYQVTDLSEDTFDNCEERFFSSVVLIMYDSHYFYRINYLIFSSNVQNMS